MRPLFELFIYKQLTRHKPIYRVISGFLLPAAWYHVACACS